MEQLLHYAWRHKIYPLTGMNTTAGLPVEVIDPGVPNTDTGPDFFNAKIKIDGTLWAGNVALHLQSSDWVRHGHHKDETYDSVILHLASRIDSEVYRSNGENILQVQFDCPGYIHDRYEELKQTAIRPRCYFHLSSLSSLTIRSWFAALQTERLQQKTNQIISRLKQHNNHWEDVFFITLSRNYGFGINGDAFETWARHLFFRGIDKHRDSLMQIEAIFFGQAGLLEESFGDPYYLTLQKEYRYLRCKFELCQVDVSLWKFLRLRPGNYPHVRLAQLARLYHQQHALFSRILEAESIKEVKQLFSMGTSEYWETHFIFAKDSPRKTKTLSSTSLDLLVINTIIPFLYAYGLHKSDERLCIRAFDFLDELKAENNRITRLWDSVGVPVDTAGDSQALIQLQKEYCDLEKCLYCRFGYTYLKKKIV